MRDHRSLRVWVVCCCWVQALFLQGLNAANMGTNMPGVLVEFRQGNRVEHRVLPELSLHIPAGRPISPSIPSGDFQSVWDATVALELRAEMVFQAECTGRFKLILNDQTVLEAEGENVVTPISKPIRLEKGPNRLRVNLSPVKPGAEVTLRVSWGEKPFLLNPIPAQSLMCSPGPAAAVSLQKLRGRELAMEMRCYRCHDLGKGGLDAVKGNWELGMDAPSFEGIGSRRGKKWMVDWILDPQSVRPGSHTHMPKVFAGVDGREKAEWVAAYLSTLKESAPAVLKDPAPWALLTPPPAEGAGEEPKPLFEKLHCQSCHVLGDSTEALGDRISLKWVNRKFPPGKLVEFLRQPDLHYRFIRMPNFRLSEVEAKELAGYVSGKGEVVDEKEWKAEVGVEVEAGLVQKGREWVVKGGCVKCHEGGPAGDYQAPGWGTLAGDALKRGCLAEPGGGGKGTESRAPLFALSVSQREDLRVYVGDGNSVGSMGVNVVDEAGVRMGRVLQCVNCHGVVEGIPTLGIMGGKLRVDWMERFVGGQVPYKPRMERHPKGEPWMFARMPAFPAYAGVLAEGLAASHGYGRGVDADLGKVDEGLAKVGLQLVGKVQGFSCVSCHGAGALPAQDVFEVEGIHFSRTAERLQRSYYRRWMRSPILVDPSTKMPGYFDEEGKSPLGDVMEGDAAKQIDAIWEYLKLGERMGVPKLAE